MTIPTLCEEIGNGFFFNIWEHFYDLPWAAINNVKKKDKKLYF